MVEVHLSPPKYTMGVRLSAESPSMGCVYRERDKWQCHFARWKGMESSITLSCDTCLSKFDQG